MFALRRPCANCPFKRENGGRFRLSYDRLTEILTAPAFQCHCTVDYSEDAPSQGDNPQQCVGWIATLAALGFEPQIVQVGRRMGVFSYDWIEPAFGQVHDHPVKVLKASMPMADMSQATTTFETATRKRLMACHAILDYETWISLQDSILCSSRLT